VDRSLTVSVPVFENSSQGGPVSVSVFLNMDEKPNRTELPSTTGLIPEMEIIQNFKDKCRRLKGKGKQGDADKEVHMIDSEANDSDSDAN
jgi:hypothetical protein